MGYCHGYRQPDEHYHDEYEHLEECERLPYRHNGESYSFEEYVKLRPPADAPKGRANRGSSPSVS